MSHRRAVALMVFVTLLWSIAGVVTRHLESARSFEVTFWRSAVTALSLALALTVMRGMPVWRLLRQAPRAVWISGACWAVMFTAFMMALTLTTVATVLVTLAIGPLVTALFARLFLRHPLPLRTWLAIAVACSGIAWMFGHDAFAAQGSLAGTLVALAVPFAGAVNWTLLQHLTHGAAEPDDAAPSQLPVQSPVQSPDSAADAGEPDMLPAVLIGATVSAAVTLPLAWPFQASLRDVGLLSMLGVVQLAIPCLIAVRLARVLPAPEISLLALLEVIFGVAWAWLGAGEAPGSSTLTGGALVLGALVANEALAFAASESPRRQATRGAAAR